MTRIDNCLQPSGSPLPGKRRYFGYIFHTFLLLFISSWLDFKNFVSHALLCHRPHLVASPIPFGEVAF